MTTGREALQKLIEGNARFVACKERERGIMTATKRIDLVDTQQPFAVILGCSDSRVPVEIVFDQTLGDLFVIRVAGNIVAPSQVGSVEFAAERFGTRLVVVLGHTRCGAVQATLEHLKQPVDGGSRNIMSIVDRIRPYVQMLVDNGDRPIDEALMHRAVRANVRASVNALRYGSDSLANLVRNDGLLIVGAEYSLDTGEVDFFDGLGA